jgi:hypothetical protein
MKRTTFVLPLVLFCAIPLSAGVIFNLGNTPQPDSPALFHDSCVGCIDGPGTLVVGHLQSSNILVHLTSPSQLVAIDSGHNTVKSPGDVGFQELNITVPGYSFTSIIFQLTELSLAPTGSVQFSAQTELDGVIGSIPFDLPHTGGTYFTITTTGATRITQLGILSTELLHDVSQIRIGGEPSISSVPEPAPFALIGAALIALRLLKRG